MVTVKDLKEALEGIDDNRNVYIHSSYDRCGDLVREYLVVDILYDGNNKIEDGVTLAIWEN